jgi:hypothetical protein
MPSRGDLVVTVKTVNWFGCWGGGGGGGVGGCKRAEIGGGMRKDGGRGEGRGRKFSLLFLSAPSLVPPQAHCTVKLPTFSLPSHGDLFPFSVPI